MTSIVRHGAIVITDGDKGGVGKSFSALTFVHCLIAAGLPWTGIDGDKRNAHLFRFHPHRTRRLPLQTPDQWDDLIDTIERDVPPDHVVLVDCPAGAGHMMERCGPRLQRFAGHQGRAFVRLFALDEEDDVLLALARTRALGFDHVVACLNGRFGASPRAFELWRAPLADAPSLREQLLAAGGLEVYVPALRASVRERLRRANLPFHRAGEIDLSWTEEQALGEWLDAVGMAFAPVLAYVTGGVR